MTAPDAPSPGAAPTYRRGGVWLTLFALAVFAILVSLGVWQLQRRAWKLDLLARIEAAERSPPQRLQTLLASRADPAALQFRRAFAYCEGLERAPYVELYGLVDGRAGWRLISACRLAESPYATILVDRGFAPDTITARPPIEPSPQVVRVEGVLRAPEPRDRFAADARAGQFFWRDIPGMAAALRAPRPAPVMLTSETPLPADAGLVAAPLPRGVSNRHLEYALTWFGLAAALVAVWVGWLWKARRGA